MQRLVRHRTPMLAVILAVLVALSSTLMMLITMGQPEETQVIQEETPPIQEEKLQDDNQLIASTNAKGKAHFGLGIPNPIEHRMISITHSEENNANATFTTATANSVTNYNNNNANANANANANNLDTRRGEENKKNNEIAVDTDSN